MGRLKRQNGHLYDVGTSNTSFLQLAGDLKRLGVKNYYFMLEVFDPVVLTIDPYQCDANGNCTLTKDQIVRVVTECRRNPWYYLREVCRIPDPGNPKGVPYKANRGNIAQAYLFLHGIDSWLCLPRQQGKTMSALGIMAWGYSFGTTNTAFIFINKQQPDAKENLARIKNEIDLLPEYLRFESYYDDEDGKTVKAIKNATEMRHPVTKNKISIRAGAASKAKAISLARGLTAAVLHYDEPEFTDFIKEIVENSVSTYETAARAARNNGSLYGRIFTCTPGDLDSAAGLSAQLILDKCNKWSERLYDMTRDEMEEFAKAGESNRIIYIEFQYYQIGLDEEWLKKMSNMIGDPLVVRREILLQRLHGSSLSPYAQEDIEYIVENMEKPIDTLFVKDYYQFKVYEQLDPTIPYIVGVDCSTGTLKDNNAITGINPYTTRPAFEFACSYVGETLYEQIIIELVTRYVPKAIVCIERNSVGDGIIDHLLNSKIASRLYYDKDKDITNANMKNLETVESMLKKQAAQKQFYGVYTEGNSREAMFAILARRIQENKNDFVAENVITDISRLVRLTSGKIAAGPGFHDDSIMSYLIAMYVFYHGNNLPIFGFIPGSKEDKPRNQGIHDYTESELSKVLPVDVVQSIEEEKKQAKLLDYESILRQAIEKSQAETSRLVHSSLNVIPEGLEHEQSYTAYDEDSDYDMSFFNDMNNLNNDNNSGFFGF